MIVTVTITEVEITFEGCVLRGHFEDGTPFTHTTPWDKDYRRACLGVGCWLEGRRL